MPCRRHIGGGGKRDAGGQQCQGDEYAPRFVDSHLLLAVDMDLSVIAIIGIILLIGIAKKNGIMLVDFALEEQRQHGLDPQEAIYQACTLRFRPILMTTMAALLGGVPLMVGTDTGSELRQPLGYTIVAGLAFSQILTLYTTPVVYLYLDQHGGWFTKRKPRAAESSSPGAAERDTGLNHESA